MPGELQLLVREGSLADEEDERERALAARLREGYREQRPESRSLRGRDEPRSEAAVLGERPGREDLARAGRRRQRVGTPCPQVEGQLVRQRVPSGELERSARGSEHRGCLALQRIGRGLRDRLQRCLGRQRLAQDRRDPVEAPLRSRLLLARLQQRALFGEPLFALTQQPRCLDRRRGLSSDRLGKRDVGGAPGRGPRPLHAEHAEQPIASEQRGCEHRPHVLIEQHLDVAERGIAELRR